MIHTVCNVIRWSISPVLLVFLVCPAVCGTPNLRRDDARTDLSIHVGDGPDRLLFGKASSRSVKVPHCRNDAVTRHFQGQIDVQDLSSIDELSDEDILMLSGLKDNEDAMIGGIELSRIDPGKDDGRGRTLDLYRCDNVVTTWCENKIGLGTTTLEVVSLLHSSC